MNAAFECDLLDWFAVARRDLPWRDCGDAYAIWVSEIMLQQTQVVTVVPYFQAFLRRFPTLRSLAEAPQADVLKLWQGLGYYSRARHLHAAAQQVMALHGGCLPADHEALRHLPGLGDYAAGAIASIAFGLPFAAVDGNVLRVFARLMLMDEDIARPATRKRVQAAITQRLRVAGDPAAAMPGEFNQALMELGATLCTPKSPNCGSCPVQRHCRAWAAGRVDALPVKMKKSPPVPVHWAVVRVQAGDETLIVQQGASGIWGHLWTFPMVEVSDGEAHDAIREQVHHALASLGLLVQLHGPAAFKRHVLTHRLMHLHLFEATLPSPVPVSAPYAWCAAQDLLAYAWPRPFVPWVQAMACRGDQVMVK